MTPPPSPRLACPLVGCAVRCVLWVCLNKGSSRCRAVYEAGALRHRLTWAPVSSFPHCSPQYNSNFILKKNLGKQGQVDTGTLPVFEQRSFQTTPGVNVRVCACVCLYTAHESRTDAPEAKTRPYLHGYRETCGPRRLNGSCTKRNTYPWNPRLDRN